VDPVQAALYAVAVPAAVAAAVLFAVRALRKGRAGEAGAGPAITAGFVAGFLGIHGLPAFPPSETWHWLPLLAAAAAVAGSIEPRVPELPRRMLRVLLFVAAIVVTSLPNQRTSFATLGTAVAGLLAAHAVESLARLGGSRAALLPVCIAAAGAAVALALFAGSAVLGMLCGALAAATAACLVLGGRVPVDARDAAVPATVVLAASCVAGTQLAELPRSSAVLLAATPLCGLLAVRLLSWRGADLRLLLRAAGGAAIAAGIAVAVAAMKSPAF
jgi:hypothetical protein